MSNGKAVSLTGGYCKDAVAVCVMETNKVLVYGTYGFYFDTEIPGQDSLTLSGLRIVSAGLDSWKRMPDIS